MSNIYVTSDLHFSHRNIIDFCNRPWDTVEEMNEGLISNWNSVVGPKDQVYILGDFAFGGPKRLEYAVNRLNGQKYLVKGNHDYFKNLKKAPGAFAWIKDYYELKLEDKKGIKRRIVMSHFPMSSWHGMGHGAIHLHGHTHGSSINPNTLIYSEDEDTRWAVEKVNNLASELGLPRYMTPLKRIDVGVDCHNWYPVSLDWIFDYMDKIEFIPVDHHTEDGNDT